MYASPFLWMNDKPALFSRTFGSTVYPYVGQNLEQGPAWLNDYLVTINLLKIKFLCSSVDVSILVHYVEDNWILKLN